MDSWCLYYVCLISSLHCLIVTWLVVAIETPTTGQYENSTILDNSSVSGTKGKAYATTGKSLLVATTEVVQVTTVKSIISENTESSKVTTVKPLLAGTTESGTATTVKSLLDFMPSCPPPNNLHLICDVTLGNITCSERAIILKLCYNRFSSSYSNSSWEICISFDNYCQDIVKFLAREHLLDDVLNKKTQKSDRTSSPEVTSQSLKPSTKKVPQTQTDSTTEETQSSDEITSEPHSKSDDISTKRMDTGMTSTTDISDISSQLDITPVLPVLDESNPMDNPPPLSWVYPLFGCLCILVEIIILWYFFWYRRQKYDTPVDRYRRASTGSMVLQEELIEPESTSPTKALYMNTEFNADSAMKEDEKIFNSYLNLRFIDDSSVEGTPERIIIK